MESWIKVTPAAGNGNGNVSISADAHTGRVARTGTVKIQNQNGTKPSKNIAVSQTAKECFFTLNRTPTGEYKAEGGALKLTGQSNAGYIWLTHGDVEIASCEFKVNSVGQINSGDVSSPAFEIADDPGATGEFAFGLIIYIPANTSAKSRDLLYTIHAATARSTPAIVEIEISLSQVGAASALSVNKEAVSLVTAGTAQIVAVTSNDDWTVE